MHDVGRTRQQSPNMATGQRGNRTRARRTALSVLHGNKTIAIRFSGNRGEYTLAKQVDSGMLSGGNRTRQNLKDLFLKVKMNPKAPVLQRDALVTAVISVIVLKVDYSATLPNFPRL
ncbi:hypothetical protein AAFF_G00048310 [Aldrovandia affinis]|uniref:Uncharacterized protein n=1 Tax=Aldrovandia affinis TaxID=143900 RepID=A0AAD7S1L9_9TELE|nr:hypothetical protein AAFF_G00048310 [Aldrovandia affinis]